MITMTICEVAVLWLALTAPAFTTEMKQTQLNYIDLHQVLLTINGSVEFVSEPSEDVAVQAAKIESIQDQVRQISKQLQLIAINEARSIEDRRAAILALGKLGDLDSLDFLAKHLELRIPVETWATDIDRINEWPCYRALGSADWNAIPPVLRHLQDKRSKWALNWSASLLRNHLGKDAATALLNDKLRSAMDDLHRENIRQVLKRVSES